MLVLLTDLLWWWNDLLVWVWVNTYYRSGRSGAKMLVREAVESVVVARELVLLTAALLVE